MPKKTVIVTGASRGLGAATAVALGRMGANVVLSARDEDALQAVADATRATGADALVVPGDLAHPATADAVVGAALARFEAVDSLVNNASALLPLAPVLASDLDAWHALWQVHVTGPLRLLRAAADMLRAQRGRVVSVVPSPSVRGIAGWGSFAATKAALEQLSVVLSAEEPDVTAVCLAPGLMDTPMQANVRAYGATAMPEATYQHFVDHHHNGDLLDPTGPALSAAVMALHAPPDWGGKTIAWDDERVRRLFERYAPADEPPLD